MAGNILARIRKMTVLAWLCLSFLVQPFSALATSQTVNVRSAPLRSNQTTRNGMVRVYLASIGDLTTLDLTTSGSYSIGQGQVLPSGTQIKVSMDASGQIAMTCQGQRIQFGKEASIRRRSADASSGIRIRQARESGNPYPGDLSFHAVYSGGRYQLYTVAHVYIENYLYGVLPYEMGNSSNIEALKAQAVAARTYTVRMMNVRASGIYDVKDTTSDQVYRGTPSGNANCVSAINSTKGIVLMYGSNFITTYYSSSNGGQTEISRSGTTYAYMTVKDDPFDYANPSSTVKRKTIYANLEHSGNSASLISLLKSKAATKLRQLGYDVSTPVLGTLQSVTPHSPKYASPSRLYTKMDFTFSVASPSVSSITVTCDIFGELESMLGMSIQSSSNELWTVADQGNTFELQARRYGHGLGMSQRGAMYMAKLGYTYDRILGFYYEGCERVKFSFTHTILNASGDEEVTVEKPSDENIETSGCYGIVSGTEVMIRNGQAESAAIIGTAGSGAMVDVYQIQGNWTLIRYGSITGYVPTGSLQITGQPDGNAQPPTQIQGFVTVTANDFVNLRASGSMSAKIVGTAVSGTVLTVFEVSGNWAKVQHNALVAYVNTGFVSAVQSQYPSASVPDLPQDMPQEGLRAVVTTQQGSLNMRSQPTVGSSVLTTIPRGAEITVTQRGDAWSGVNYQGMNGYVMTSFLTFTDEPETPPAEPSYGETATVVTPSGTLNLRVEPQTGSGIIARIPPGETVQVHHYGNEWSQVEWSGMSGYVMTRFLSFEATDEEDEPEQEPVLPQHESAVVHTSSGALNVRSQPSATSQVLGTLQRGVTIEILAYGSEWCAMRYGALSGYVMTKFLRFDAQTETEPEQPSVQTSSAWVNTSSGMLNLRSRADASAQILLSIPRLAEVTCSGTAGEWTQVTYQGVQGYVMSRFLTWEKPRQEAQVQAPSVVGGMDISMHVPDRAMHAVAADDNGITLRPTCVDDGEMIAFVPPGMQVEVILIGDHWACVQYDGVQGYCKTERLSVINP